MQIVPRTGPGALSPGAGTQPVTRVDSSLVLIPVHVTTATGASVTSLTKEDFIHFEDGVRQTIAGMLLDISGSTKNQMGKASEAATRSFQFANPQDEFFLVAYN